MDFTCCLVKTKTLTEQQQHTKEQMHETQIILALSFCIQRRIA